VEIGEPTLTMRDSCQKECDFTAARHDTMIVNNFFDRNVSKV
jgi:hypothetical protein